MRAKECAELYDYMNQNPPPLDGLVVKCVHKHLTACNLMFERGFLSHDRVDVHVLDNTSKGFVFFRDWLQLLLDKVCHGTQYWCCIPSVYLFMFY